jgi:prolyl oligopeptidase
MTDRLKLSATVILLCGVSAAPVAADPPPAARKPVSDTYFGETLSDPYRWMESGGPDFVAWSEAQGDFTRTRLTSLPGYAELAKEVSTASEAEIKVTSPLLVEDRLYFKRRGRGEAQESLFVRNVTGGEERRLVDPVELGDDTTTITDFAVSPDNRRLAFSLSRGGSEEAVLRVMELDGGRVLPEVIDRSRMAGPTWSPDGTLLFYNRLKASFSGPEDRFSDQTVYRHVPGQDPQTDVAVFTAASVDSEIGRQAFVGVLMPVGSRYALAFANSGVSHEAEWFVAPVAELSLGDAPRWARLARLSDQLVLTLDGENTSLPTVRGDQAWFASLKDAPSGKVVKVDLAHPDASKADTAVPERTARLTGAAGGAEGLYLTYAEGGEHRLELFGYESGHEAPYASPYAGAITALTADPRRPRAVIALESWVRPAQAFVAGSGGLRDLGLSPPYAIRLSDIVTHTVTATAKDGTPIPVSVTHRQDLKRDGSAPTLVEAYGSYGISNDPAFHPELVPFLQRGGIWAVAHVRGGGEFGERWHLAGKGANKANTWRDFIAAVETLEADGYTSPARVAGMGASAGGVMIGRAVTERPDLLAAAVMWAPISNTLRFEETEGGPANTAEFGSVATPEGYAALRDMDPYSHVADGAAYPATLITIGLNDHRVPPWMGAEMAARMQHASSGGKPVLLRVDVEGGHHVLGVSKADADAQITDMIAFVLQQTGDPAFQQR